MNELDDVGVLITRPRHQSENLKHLIENVGGRVYLFPTLEIEPLTQNIESVLENIAAFDIAIFTSANAVRSIKTLLEKYWPAHLLVGAMGLGTEAALAEINIPVNFLPEAPFSSENLLKHPFLQTVKAKNILIITGENGRTLISNSLTERGAAVKTLITYRRLLPNVAEDQKQTLINAWQNGKIQAVICTSNEALDNLITLLGEKGQNLLENTKVIGVSSRLLALTKKLKLQNVTIASNATDEALSKTLIKIFN